MHEVSSGLDVFMEFGSGVVAITLQLYQEADRYFELLFVALAVFPWSKVEIAKTVVAENRYWV